MEAGRNRRSDRYIPPLEYRAVWVQADLPEDPGIYTTLLERAAYFMSNSNNIFNYDCIPELATSFNSNSFVAGLLDAASLLKPATSPLRYPGWSKPVPLFFFGIVP